MSTTKQVYWAANRHRKTAIALTGFGTWMEVQGAARCGILLPDNSTANAIGRCKSLADFQKRAKQSGYTVLHESQYRLAQVGEVIHQSRECRY